MNYNDMTERERFTYEAQRAAKDAAAYLRMASDGAKEFASERIELAKVSAARAWRFAGRAA